MSLGLCLLVAAAATGSAGRADAAKQFYTIVEACIQPAPLYRVTTHPYLHDIKVRMFH